MAEVLGGHSPDDKTSLTPEKNPQLEVALANRLIGRGESLNDELISSAETPQQLFYGLRAIERKLEDGNIPPSLTESYRPPGQLSILFNRAEVLKLSNEELQRRGWLKNYNPGTGEGLPMNRKYSSLALGIEEDFVVKDGEVVSNIFGQPETKFVFKYGTEKERAELARAYERAILELEARAILGEHVGVRLNLAARDSLEDLVNWEHTTTAKFRGDHLQALFNMPDVEELETKPENHTLGDRVEEAMFLNLVMLNSGGKIQMIDFLERPGSKYLMAKLAKEQGITYDEWVQKNIGDTNRWEDDNKRLLTDGKDKNGKEVRATFFTEAADGRRGSVTQWGNISAWGGKPGEFSKKNEDDFIEETIGGLVGSVEASWIAASMMKATGAYASEGYVALPNGKSNLPLGEARFITGDDSGKFWAYMFNLKEGTKGRSSGLKDMIGKIPDLAMNLFDWWQVEVSDIAKNPDGTPAKRSIWDVWLGTAGGKAKKDLLTGKETAEKTIEEPYHPLREIKFDSADRDVHGSFGIMQWLTGRKDSGVFTEAMKVDFGFEEFSLNELKKKNKFIGIVMNSVILTKGSTQLYTNSFEAPKIIAKNFLRNLMLARIHSFTFSTTILNKKEKLFNPNMADVDVPAPLLVKAFVTEVLKDNPTNEELLLKRYIDENKDLRTLGTKGTSGLTRDISTILEEKFEPSTQQERELVRCVGKITGRES